MSYNGAKEYNQETVVSSTSHSKRVIAELKEAGVHPLELRRHMFKLLPDIIRPNEHIEAIVYGLNENQWHALIAATDHRVIYLEADLVFNTQKEVPYEIIHGTEQVHAPLKVGIKLITRAGDYTLKYVNKSCAKRFVAYMEDRVEKMGDLPSGFVSPYEPSRQTSKKNHAHADELGLNDLSLAHIYDVQRDFLKHHHQLIITDTGRDNTLASQALRYHMHDNALFAVADHDIAKIFNIKQPLAATIHDTDTGRTLQLEVLLKVEMSPSVLSMGLESDQKAHASKIYRLQIIDLAFIASQN